MKENVRAVWGKKGAPELWHASGRAQGGRGGAS